MVVKVRLRALKIARSKGKYYVYVRQTGEALLRGFEGSKDALLKRLSEENRKDVNAFRAVELEKEIERKRRDMEALERDLKKVRAA
jgi:hypothetical protein